jgi:hypothetical protein
MNIIPKFALVALCAALLAGCVSKHDQAVELAKKMNIDARYDNIMRSSALDYMQTMQYTNLSQAKIAEVVKKHVSKEILTKDMVDSLEKDFDSDELELLIGATKQSQNMDEFIMGSKGGAALVTKVSAFQMSTSTNMNAAIKSKEQGINEDLANANRQPRG